MYSSATLNKLYRLKRLGSKDQFASIVQCFLDFSCQLTPPFVTVNLKLSNKDNLLFLIIFQCKRQVVQFCHKSHRHKLKLNSFKTYMFNIHVNWTSLFLKLELPFLNFQFLFDID